MGNQFSLSPAKIMWISFWFVFILCFIIPGITGTLANIVALVLVILLILAIYLSSVEAAVKQQNLSLEANNKQKKLEIIIKDSLLQKFSQLKSQFSESIANEILNELKQVSPSFDSQFIYDLTLDLLLTHSGDIRIKVFALNVGRFHYSLQRPDRSLTIYDEQAIQNDISTRSS